MNVRWLNFRDDQARFSAFCRQTALFQNALEDGQAINPGYNFAQDLQNPALLHCGSILDGEVQGLFKFVQCGLQLFELHAVLVPELRNRAGFLFAQEALNLFWQLHPHATLYAFVPAFNRPALMAAYSIGFEPRGKLSHAFLKNKKWHSRILLEKRNAWHRGQ